MLWSCQIQNFPVLQYCVLQHIHFRVPSEGEPFKIELQSYLFNLSVQPRAPLIDRK